MKRALHLLLVALLAFPSSLWAAIPAGAIWEFNAGATASNVNSGFFNYANASFITDFTATSATGNAPVISSATYNFVAGDVGHWLYIQTAGGSANWVAGRFCVIASVASNQATLTATIGTCVDLANRQYTPSLTAGVATAASPTGGVIGIDYSRSTAARIDGSGGAADLASLTGTTNPCTVTSAGQPFGPQHAGNSIHINSGTNWTATWYEIVSVSVITATLDKACGSAATLTAGTYRVGGAMSFNSNLSDDVLEMSVAGNQIWFTAAGGGFTTGEAIALGTAAGTAQLPIILAGYNTLRGDLNIPSALAQPTIAGGATGTTFGAAFITRNLTVTTTVSGGWSVGAGSQVVNMNIVNAATAADAAGVTLAADSLLYNSSVASYRGRAVSCTTFNCTVRLNRLYSSNVGVYSSGTGNPVTICGNTITGLTTAGVQFTAAHVDRALICDNTFIGGGATVKSGIGVSMATGVADVALDNNNFIYLTTGVTHADTQSIGFDQNNNYFGNTNDVSAAGQWQKGRTDTAIDPSFTSAVQYSIVNATVAAAVITKVGATFQTSGVVAGRDAAYVSAGAGATIGMYGITAVGSETEITLDSAPGGAGTDLTVSIITGQNFYPGAALSGQGFPGAMQGGYTAGYKTPGAIQRNGAASAGGGGIIGQ